MYIIYTYICVHMCVHLTAACCCLWLLAAACCCLPLLAAACCCSSFGMNFVEWENADCAKRRLDVLKMSERMGAKGPAQGTGMQNGNLVVILSVDCVGDKEWRE